mmetsp:Transcript_16770/g.45482  ORF Transcript_16770/g.45482 Transcript_16770/m.45482 type:complete len:88 (+) Transcript_16770:391-654(+)
MVYSGQQQKFSAVQISLQFVLSSLSPSPFKLGRIVDSRTTMTTRPMQMTQHIFFADFFLVLVGRAQLVHCFACVVHRLRDGVLDLIQ